MADGAEGNSNVVLEVEMKKGANGAGNDEVDFKDISVDETFKLLQCNREGLSAPEAAARLEQYGPNKLPEDTRNAFLQFLSYMWNPLSWAMEVAAILAICLLDYVDFALIIALLFLNASISFYEESSADKAIKALTAALAPKAKALRDGSYQTIDAKELVPGDVVLLKFGDVIPADVKLIGEEGNEEAQLQVDQAALTGESLPVKKRIGDVAFSGSAVKQGEMPAVVYATGASTFFGRAATLLSTTHNVANLQKVMTRIGAICLITIAIWIIIEIPVMFGRWGHSCYAGESGCPALTNLLVIIVGGIPIAMPTVLSVTLALGAAKLAKDGAIVARMSAVEEMAGMTILCSDKTGTLTLNQLSIDRSLVFPVGRFDVDEAMKHGALSANIITEEPIDMVLYNSYEQSAGLKDLYDTTKYIPFNPTDKYTVAYIKGKTDGSKIRIMKGAPQVVLKRAHNFDDIHTVVQQKITEYAGRGFRALGISVAEGDGPVEGSKWEFVGLIPLFDPPRHDTKETIDRCREMGVGVKMVTGDQTLIGKETARQLGMGSDIQTIEVLHEAKERGEDIGKFVEDADGFAEVFPEHKFEIVEILQKRGHLVGMTGDGVNDAPALKKADVGVAVAGATDAARGAADIVLTADGLGVIVGAIIGARKIFQRMTTYSRYTVAMTFRITFTFGLITCIFNWFFPTVLVVIFAVLNDGSSIALSKDRVTPPDTPTRWNLTNIFVMGIGYGCYLAASSVCLFAIAAKTQFFTNMGLFSLCQSYTCTSQWCTEYITENNPPGFNQALSLTAPATTIQGYSDIDFGSPVPTVIEQCMAEQIYLRESMLRTLLYLQVSVSGQALIFVVRDLKYSFFSRAGAWTYGAFIIAQACATIIALFGFNGYTYPRDDISDGAFAVLPNGNTHPFWPAKRVPRWNSEGQSEASVIGCIGYVLVAWIWAFIWHLGLDPLKWVMAYALNEDGFRDKKSHLATKKRPVDVVEEEPPPTVAGMAGATYANPLGRVSLVRVSANELERMSVLNRTSVMPTQQTLERASIISRQSQPGVEISPAGAAAV